MLDPIDRAALSSVVQRHARLLCLVREDVGERPLVLPTAEFFPDRFTRDEASVGRLVSRMLSHAGLSDVPVTTRVIADEEASSPHEGGCTSGCTVPYETAASSTPRLIDNGDGFVLNIPAQELSHPVVLTTMIARALGHVLLVETLPPGSSVEAPVELAGDYAAVSLGFGLLLLEGAHIYSLGCGGPRIACVTAAGVAELAVLTALFIETGRHTARRAMKELSATQADALGRALEWARSNPEVCRRLENDPERVAAGDFTLAEAKPWLLRVFGKKTKEPADELPADLLVRRAEPAKHRDPESDELAGLVDEALRAARTDAE